MKLSLFPTIGTALFVVTSFLVVTPQQAGAKHWDMCSWEEIPLHVMKRIAKRPDYAEILNRMNDNCPDSLLAFTDTATSSVAEFLPKRADSQQADASRELSQISDTPSSGLKSSATSPGDSGGSSRSGSDSGNSSGDGGRDSSGESSGDNPADSHGPDGADTSGGRGSNANNGGGNGSEGGSPGKGSRANDDE